MPLHIDQAILQKYANLELLAKQIVEGFITGLHKSPFHGFSVEFAEHRLYNTGESTKNIDWKLYARSDKLFSKRFEEETNLRCQIVIDTSSSMYYPIATKLDWQNINKLQFSVAAAAALIFLLKKQRDAVGLSLFADTMHYHVLPKSNSVHHKLLWLQLEKLLQQTYIENNQTMLGNALHTIAETIHKRSLVIIFSDMFDSYDNTDNLFSALQHFRHNKHEVILFLVHDHAKELQFDFDKRLYKFIDMETKQEVKLNPSEIKDKYNAAIENYMQQIKLKCAQYRIECIFADIKAGFDQVLMPYLLKRSKLY